MYFIKNVSSAVVSVGNQEFVFLPGQELAISLVDFERLKSEILALSAELVVSASSTTYSAVGNKTRTQVTGGAQALTTAAVIGGNIHRITVGTGVITDTLPSASDLAALVPGYDVGTSFELVITHAIGGTPNYNIQNGSGISFTDDWAAYANAMHVYPGNVNHVLFTVTQVTPSILMSAKVMSSGGSFFNEFVNDGYVHVGYGGSGTQVFIDKGLAIQSGTFLGLTPRFRKKVATPVLAAAPFVFTSAMLIGGYIIRDSGGPGITDATTTAADIVNTIGLITEGSVEVGSFLEFTINNIGANAVALNGGVGVTPYGGGPFVIGVGAKASFLLIVDNIGSGAEACSIYPK